MVIKWFLTIFAILALAADIAGTFFGSVYAFGRRPHRLLFALRETSEIEVMHDFYEQMLEIQSAENAQRW
jgi:hypothetical protein